MLVSAPPLPPIEVPNANLAEHVLGECRRRAGPDHVVFVDSDSGESLTVGQLETLTRRFARGLRARGIRAGDKVAIFAANSIYYPFVAYGIVAAGAVCAPANPLYTPRDLAHQLSDMSCRAIVVGDGLQDTVMEAQRLIGRTLDHVWAMDESKSMCEESVFHVADAAADDGDGDDCDDDEVPVDHMVAAAYVCYSSGTTGKPKGVVLTHCNMIANMMQINSIKTLDVLTANQRGYEIYLGLAPFCHTYGLSFVLHSSVALGGQIVVMRRYSFDALLTTVEEHHITYAYVVPPIVCALSKDPRVASRNLSSMHTLLSGGAALSPTLIRTTEERLPGLRVVQGYGMTEMSPVVTMLSTRHNNPASIGVLIPGCQAKVVDDQGAELGPNTAGELCFRGPNVMPGYLGNAAATREIIHDDGFLHTGDIGYIDDAGFFYVTDRKKELIKFKGFQVAPAELEALLAEHPYIEDAAVMAVYDENQATELPRGYLVLKPSDEDDRVLGQQVVDWLDARVAPFKRLRGGFEIVDHIPRSPAGKIIRSALRNKVMPAAAAV
ncbi:hypothetical protein LPJ61_000707 [Coemansia biformis]|uniref:Acetyl-CoA synthetase-like protein n=1 Tax=Coemansia biformis TaxID=1286918 RepID=A0A9W8D0A4_9FUNG|nr:hypothetical protein LPJ61_000707 [Coemansia biformis]